MGILRKVAACAAATAVLGLAGSPAHAGPTIIGLAAASVGLAAYTIIADPPVAPDSDRIALEGGRFDVVKNKNPADYFSAEYRPAFWVWKLQPIAGVGGTDEGAAYAYAGARLPLTFGDFTVAPSLALAAYDKGEDGRDLGSSVVARCGLDVEYTLPNGFRVGVGFHHMSHARVFNHRNPGTEFVGLSLSIPLGPAKTP